jgi:TolB protein
MPTVAIATLPEDFWINASFSKDGKWIVFTSDRAGSADIYRAHPDGTGLERLTDDPAFDDQSTLLPDGRSMAGVANFNGPDWSVDGRKMVY